MSAMKGGEACDKSYEHPVASVAVSRATLAVVHGQSADGSLMFGGAKDATRSVALGLDLALQRRLWQLVERIPAQERDYLQNFELSAGFDMRRGILQSIVHLQEEPPRQQEHDFASHRPVCGKLFAVDDGAGHSTLLWADEY